MAVRKEEDKRPLAVRLASARQRLVEIELAWSDASARGDESATTLDQESYDEALREVEELERQIKRQQGAA